MVLSLGSLGDTRVQSSQNSASNPLLVHPAEHDFTQNPKLLARILASPHGYFRFINIAFSKEVCRRFSEALAGTPSFNLHGDAHIEQYAVTDLGRGLTDFDDSSTGPAVLDLLRFGVSVHLACQAHGWSDRANALFDQLIAGYRLALHDPTTEAPEPAFVKRMRAKFRFDRGKYLAWVDSIQEPMPDEERAELTKAMQPYVESMTYEQPELTKEFFRVQKVGYLRMGIGSALDLKYLVRIKGESEDPNDDLVLEVKQVRDISGIDCIITQKSDPFRVLVGQARIAYQPYDFLGYIRLRRQAFWVHSWVDNYKELEVGESLQSADELAEIAFDVGVQLGRGHTNQIAAPLDAQLRREQLRLLNRHEAQVKKLCGELAKLTHDAWEQFYGQVDEKRTTR